MSVVPLGSSPTSYFYVVTCSPVAHICNVLTLEGTGRHHVVPLKPRMEVNPSAWYLHSLQSSSRPSPGPYRNRVRPLYWAREVTTMSLYNRNWTATPDEQLKDTVLSVKFSVCIMNTRREFWAVRLEQSLTRCLIALIINMWSFFSIVMGKTVMKETHCGLGFLVEV